MIGYLSGKPVPTRNGVLILCGGVGYSVLVCPRSLRDIVQTVQVELFIYPHIKEDAFDLYGFVTEEEKDLFLKLITVDGVGPKTAMGIMDRGIKEIVAAVQTADVSFFSSIPRVGKKSAQKIIIELKNKLGGKEDLDLAEPTGVAKEVVEALTSLGFSDTESIKVTKSMDLSALRVEDAVKKAIQSLTAR